MARETRESGQNDTDYYQQLAKLMQSDNKESVTFTPHQFLRAVIENSGAKLVDMDKTLEFKPGYCRSLLRERSVTLPGNLAVKLSALSVNSPYNQPIFWLQKEYVLQNAAEIPQLDLTRSIPTSSVQKSAIEWHTTVSSPRTICSYKGK